MAGIETSKIYELYYHDVDYKKKALITTLINYFGDLATYQSEELGIGMDFLKAKNVAWVLYKWDIEIEDYPCYGERITVKTRPYSFKKFYAYRTFEILSEKGVVLGRAKSLWFLIDRDRRRPVRVNEEFYKAYKIDMDKSEELDIDPIDKIKEIHFYKDFDVRYSDIDTNRHVNNSKYVAWALETVPLEIVLNHSIRRIKVVYEKETTYGDIIKSCTEVVDNGDEKICLHKIANSEGKELTLLQTYWK